MVMTRHRGDPDDRAYADFVSLQSRSTRRRQSAKPEPNGFDGSDTDDQNESASPPTDYDDSRGTRSKAGAARDVNKRTMRTRTHVQDEEEEEEAIITVTQEMTSAPEVSLHACAGLIGSVDSELRQFEGTTESEESQEEYRQSKFLRNKPSPPVGRRTRRSRELLHLHRDPSEDEEILHQEPMGRRRHFRRPSIPQEPEHQSPRRRGRTRRIEVIDDTEEDDDEGAMPVKFSPRRSSQRIVTPTKLIDRDSGSIRRSTRQKKLLYGTFNQSLIEKHVMLMGEEDEDEVHAGEEGAVQHRKRKRSTEVEPTPEQDGLDMYSRVKRVRRQVKRDMYGIPINEDEQQEDTDSSSDTSAEDEDDEEDEEEVTTKQGRQYYLRQHKPRTNLYEAAPIQPQKRQTRGLFRNITPPRTFRATTYRSPAHKSPHFRNRSTSASAKKQEKKSTPKPAPREKKSTPKPASRQKKSTPKPASRQKKTAEAQEKPKTPRRRPQFHGNSSTSSSSDSESEDEQRFQRRKAKSMARNRNRCLPMNFTAEDVGTGMLKDRTKIGTSLADVDPMSVDKNVSFDSVGGLGKHIRSLKEMIVFPLLYPEVFERFKISPPRGVLFYGPPGTGKTLVARALANECGSEERKVAFFMRKGADCLSKWVGESERQLRLLFDQAYQMRPSIIFFDEIDGLAPVRSSRQDQIHSSIVSTLLALMDGLDNRGEIVIIGATNRLDSIDPALRRPGRFDREFLFPLPSVEARKQILQIHTKEWNPKLCEGFLTELAGNCVGYCGADLKALCTEGALHALRRRYPQIYTSEDKLELDVSAIEVSARDFHKAMQNIVPASQRSVTSPGRALDGIIKPLMINVFQRVLVKVESMFPMVITNSNSLNAPVSADKSTNNEGQDELCSDEDDDDSQPIYEASARNGRKKRNGNGEVTAFTGTYLNFMRSATQRPFTYRPRLLLAGEHGQGQSTHLGPALLHQLERVPVHIIDLPALYAVSAHTPEEACAQIFREARRTSPSILYMPHIGEFWDVISPTLQATFLALLYDLEPTMPIFMVATSEMKHYELPQQVKCLFGSEEIVTMENPSEDERRDFFEDLLLNQLRKPPATRKIAATRVLEVLPKAKPVEPRKLTETELKQLQKQEEKHLRELRLFLRDILNKLGRDRKFGIFAKPVDTEDVPDYYEIIRNPMDLSAMMTKIDLHKYQGVKEFLDDINLICSNALEYNPDKDPAGRAIRHRACALRDTCQALIEAELDPEFEKLCDEVRAARERRGEESSATVPSFYYTKPAQAGKYPSRFERASGDIETEEQDISTWQEGDADTGLTDGIPDNGPKIRAIVKRVIIHRKVPISKNKSPWCRPSKKRYRKIIVYVDEFGNEVPPPGGAGGDKAGVDGEEGDKDIEEPSPSAQDKDKGSKDEAKDDTDATVEVDPEAATEEKENKPNSQASNSAKAKSQPSSPNVTPPVPSLRSASRQGRSPVSTGAVLTRSTSPRSVSPRGRRSDRPTETPRRASHGSPRAELKMDEAKTTSPKMQRRRSSRSAHGTADSEQMDISPAGSSEQPPQTTPQTSPKSNTASPPAAGAASSSPPSTSTPPQPKSVPSTSTPCPPNTTESSTLPTTEKATTEETSADANEEKTETATSPKVRLTRSKSQVPAAVEAMAKRLLETDTPTRVIVDEDELRFLLVKTVSHTRNATVEHLEKLYCRLSQAIYAHRSNIDKTDLLQDLGLIVSSFATNHRSST